MSGKNNKPPAEFNLAKVSGGKHTLDMDALQLALQNSVDDLPESVQRRVHALKNLHKNFQEIEKKYREEVRALEKKYEKLYDPLFLKRAAVVNGEHEPTDEEARPPADEESQKDENAEAKSKDKKDDKDVKGIPEFWLKAMKNQDVIAETIFPDDEGALRHLKDIRCSLLEGDQNGFALSFHFSENPYFTDSVLTKTYFLVDDDAYGELVFDHAVGTKINWKPGKNLTVRLVKKKQKNRSGRGKKQPTRVKTTEEPCDSFFNFFNPPNVDESSELSPEEEEQLDAMLEADFETGCIFKDELVRKSVQWFTGEAAELAGGAFDFDEDDFDDEEGDDDGDDDDDDDDDDEEEEEAPRGGRGGNKSKGAPSRGGKPSQGGAAGSAPGSGAGAPQQPQQPECKQQ